MIKKFTKKAIAILLLILTVLSAFSGYSLAAPSEAYLQNKGHSGNHVQFHEQGSSDWVFVVTHYVVYIEGGKEYPAYCLNRDLPGVGTADDYTVDLTKLLDDPGIWRAAINGYPYKTPEQLGVEDKIDAFMATKQAIYCMIYNYNPSDRFRGADEKGNKIVQAIINIVNAARNGTQTPYNSGISANKVGELKEDGNFYSQEFEISCGVSTSSYTITSNSGLPNGSQITNMSNNVQNTFNGGEHFKVRIPKNELSKDINAVIALQAKAQTYPVFYGQTRIPGTQNYAVTYDPLGDVTGTVTLNIKTNTGKIKVVKNDAETNLPIAGVTFQLLKKDGTVVANATTNEKGEATFSSLYQGDYTLKETATNDNYILNEKEFDVNVEYNKTATTTITNEHKRGDLKIYKVDKDNHKITLGNVEFQLYSEEFGRVIGTYRTDVNGEIKIENLRTGNYKLIETETNRWYNLAEDTEVKIEWNNVTDSMIENELKKGQIKVIKVDKDNNEIKLEGVEFEVLNENDEVLEKIITDENGEALTSRYPVRDFSKLKLRESKTLENYVLSDEEKTITLKENEITSVKFENQLIQGYVQVTKVDSKTGATLEGAEFGIYNENDEQVGTLKTDETGKATSELLPYGKYYLKELDTGSVYYLLNENTYEFEIKNYGETVPETIENEPVEITVDDDKKGTSEIKPGEKVNYEFSNVANNSNIYLDSFKFYDSLPTDYIRLEKMTTGTWNQDLTYDVYYKTNKSEDYILFKEDLSTNENYDLDFTTIQFSENEYITETMFDFGKVEKGFREVTKPTMQCQSLNTVKDGDTFTNHTKTVGVYYGVTAEADSDWTTVVHVPEEKHEVVLPKTGK